MNVYMNGALNCYATLYIRYARLYIYIYIYIWLVNVWCILYIYTRYALYMQLHCTYANHFYFVF